MSLTDFLTPTTAAALGTTVLFLVSGHIFFVAGRAGGPRRAWRTPLIWACLLGGLFLLRWPSISLPRDLSADESAFVSDAARCLKHPTPWKEVDAITSGPWNYWSLALPLALGAPASWVTARIMLWATNGLTLLLLYRSLRLRGSPTAALLGIIPTICLYGFFSEADYTHFSSETVPVLLLSAAGYLALHIWHRPSASSGRFLVSGFLLGCLPFAKLQAAPLSIFWGLVFLAGAVCVGRRGLGWRPLLAFLGGSALFPLVLLLWLIRQAALHDFWYSYILNAIQYRSGANGSFLLFWSNLSEQFQNNIPWVAYLFLVLCLAAWQQRIRPARHPGETLGSQRVFLLFAAACWASLYCVLAPGRTSHHYLLLLIPSAALLAGFAVIDLVNAPPGPPPDRRWFLLSAVGLWLMLAAGSYWGNLTGARPEPADAGEQEITAALAPHLRPGDELSVWGWWPALYLKTGLIPATRDSITDGIIKPGPLQGYYRETYLRNFQQARPAFFIDAVAAGAPLWTLRNPKFLQHECFPPFAAYVAENYLLLKTVHCTPRGAPVRLYLRKDRASTASSAGQ